MARINLLSDGAQPQVKVASEVFPPAIPDQGSHDKLLEYLQARLTSDQTKRSARLRRFASIDRAVSTWQQLDSADTQREAKQDATGAAQAVKMVLPLTHTHIDDMASFFASIYAPTNGEFFTAIKPEQADGMKTLIEFMRTEAKQSKYYRQVASSMRTLLKYNIGGMAVRWIHNDFDEEAVGSYEPGRNQYTHLDMYNFLWDPSIDDPAKIATEGEWAAHITVKNRIWLLRREQEQHISGCAEVLEQNLNSTHSADFYKNPPRESRVAARDGSSSTSQSSIDWDAYGMSLGASQRVSIDGYELIEMYCWIQPSDFDLAFPGAAETEADGLHLWRFLILAGKKIVSATPVHRSSASAQTEGVVREEIPYYLAYLNQDEMGESQRSVGELMRPFQNYGSFLINSHMDQIRHELVGVTVYDPTAVDFGSVPEGTVGVRLPTKKPGADVRNAVARLNSDASNRDPMRDLLQLLQLIREFFPAQAVPNQVASIDRAIQSQVGAVMQGIARRLQLYMRVLDADMMGPSRLEGYRNIAKYSPTTAQGLEEDAVSQLLGSGVQSMNNELAAQQLNQILFALIQNPQASSEFDIGLVFKTWSMLVNLDLDLTAFRRPNPQPGPGAPGAEGAAPTGPVS